MTHVSPELALIDPDLAARARGRLRAPGDCLRPPLAAASAAASRATGSRLHRAAASAAASGLALTAVALAVVSSLPGTTPSTVTPLTSQTRGPALTPGRQLPAPGSTINLRWPALRGASFYNIVLWRNGARVHDFWPTKNHLVLPASGGRGGARLPSGSYLWFAFAGFRERGHTRFSRTLAQGTLVVRGS